MRMARLCVLAALVVCGVAANTKAPEKIEYHDIGRTTLILGNLLRPVGETVSIHGKKFTNGPIVGCFFVDEVNGEKFEKGTTVQIPGIEEWPDDTEATLSGFEVGTLRFSSIRDGNRNDGGSFRPKQVVYLDFKLLKVLQPAGLQFDRNKAQ